MTEHDVVRHQNIQDSEDSTGSLSPLPPVLTNGLAAVAMFGFLSFLSCVWLFGFLTYKFVRWQVRPRPDKTATSPVPESPVASDANGFLVPASHLCPQKDDKWRAPKEGFFQRLRNNPPNQFLMLIYNLLLADIQQAMAFLLNVTWLSRHALEVENSVCWAQGWFISTGDLASSVFISAIAVHTYLGVVKGYRLPTRIFYAALAFLWSFIYGLAILGVIITRNGEGVGGLYVRAGAWCWINSAYQDLRLYLHYLWIFLSLALTTIVYIAIFLHLQIHSKHSPSTCHSTGSAHNLTGEKFPNPDPASGSAVPSLAPSSPRSVTSMSFKQLPQAPSSARHPTFLLYPIIYVLCTAPLAAGRIASMAGNNVPLSYFCFAGVMIASAGWLDVALYSTTRRAIVFSGEAPPSQDTGLDTFAFMRTPADRKFGNVVLVSANDPKGTNKRWAGWSTTPKKSAAARLRSLGSGNNSRNGSKDTVNSSMQGFGMGDGEVMGMAIQCETTTTVTVEQVVEEKERKGSDASSGSGSIPAATRPIQIPS
ncbi:G protein-coupled glucose receptor regulating Gpa2-domain-containing protein [Lasiosphaeria miniovina]|uniref:G protein-coupled glucose receptor regulating Gpa2-domain-containing protein n=1 Tax=Lasiosphaeria miniovina TaxID=1954250 RepID=A0AA40B4P1_9PEZI|nr:G protein-coupled glucose receptor regulating Gpa2-domain-containing protein [Lasiosphaeria miniovina]KAK0727539.1 G protein-coupled glucose receptor regulating Gpa2-domain-containing protein [Lasiosphaeria miniovina]